MNQTRFLFVLIFILGLLIGPMQSSSEPMGFVPLVLKLDISLPFRAQAKEAFYRLMPQLIAAQKSKIILGFEPDFSAGILIIRFATRNHASNLDGIPIFDSGHKALAMVPHKKLGNPRSREGAYNPKFYLYLYSGYFVIYGLMPEDHVIGSLRNKIGRVVSNYEGDADSDGELYDFDGWGSYNAVQPGFKITFKVFASNGASHGTFTVNAPTIEFSAIDKLNSIVSGTGPASKPYRIYRYHPNLDARNTYISELKRGRISGSSSWKVDFGTPKFRGSDHVYLYVEQTTRFTFYRDIYVPYAYCELGSNYCGIYGFPRRPAVINITHNGIEYAFSGKFSHNGAFSSVLEDEAGYPIFLSAGDSISGTEIPSYIIPNITTSINFTADVVSGLAPAKKYFSVYLRQVYGNTYYSVWSHSDSTGYYIAGFGGKIDLRSGDALTANVDYRDPVTGNFTAIYRAYGY